MLIGAWLATISLGLLVAATRAGVGMPAQAWVTLVVGTAATVGVLVTWRQKNRSDNRSEWWRRATWALERTFETDSRQATLGWAMLDKLVQSPLATKDDSDIVQVVAEHAALGDGDVDVWEDEDGEESLGGEVCDVEGSEVGGVGEDDEVGDVGVEQDGPERPLEGP